ncbi:unnamed protein product [Prorocentrum cordatum]|uniref:Altered inheritance of mitochondria protein 24, mitochondrial n=1 Tax=Prorocentrum cordatum TaxID=2364126 RepID=A0ABN9SYU4_9DINO|nr:unnamed protein product [Polarella glacialis]
MRRGTLLAFQRTALWLPRQKSSLGQQAAAEPRLEHHAAAAGPAVGGSAMRADVVAFVPLGAGAGDGAAEVPPVPGAADGGMTCSTCGAIVFPGAVVRSMWDVATDPICVSEFGAVESNFLGPPPARAFAAEEPARGRDDEGDGSGIAASGPLRGRTARRVMQPPPAAGAWEPVGLPVDTGEGLLFANCAASSSVMFFSSPSSSAGMRLTSSTAGAGFT